MTTRICAESGVVSLIGTGGMSAVYRAEHVQLGRPVALKVLNPEMASMREAMLRFEREALLSAKIQHPHVVGATDMGRLDDGSSYLVLELVEGQSLRERINADEQPDAVKRGQQAEGHQRQPGGAPVRGRQHDRGDPHGRERESEANRRQIEQYGSLAAPAIQPAGGSTTRDRAARRARRCLRQSATCHPRATRKRCYKTAPPASACQP